MILTFRSMCTFPLTLFIYNENTCNWTETRSILGFFFNVIIIITSFHSNVKEEEGEGRVESLLAQLFSAAQAVVVSAHGAFQRRSWKC